LGIGAYAHAHDPHGCEGHESRDRRDA